MIARVAGRKTEDPCLPWSVPMRAPAESLPVAPQSFPDCFHLYLQAMQHRRQEPGSVCGLIRSALRRTPEEAFASAVSDGRNRQAVMELSRLFAPQVRRKT